LHCWPTLLLYWQKWVTGMEKSRLAIRDMPFLHDTFWHFSTLFW
jgi:hypothetical protein